ncbi:MAG: solute carrier family 26 protein [Cyclobacteriaceae bacterium]
MNLKTFFPILDWLPNYKKAHLSGDLSAGLTVGVMLIPQGMAYAMIAGLPPVYGLYAAMIPQVVYAIFGTSRQLAVGPVAMDSLLVAAGVSVIAAAGSENYIALAILLSFMMGIVQVAFGVFRLGFLVNFLSKPVISGFTSAAALIIGLNQLKHVLGVEIARNNNIFKILYEGFAQFESFNWISIGIGLGGIVIIKNIKRVHKSIPGALVAVIMGILFVQFGELTEYGITIVGEIPKGLPGFAIPDLSNEHFNELIPVALTLALIAFMEAISVAKAIQSKRRGEYELDNNQEMIGLGMGNVVGSFFACYPTTGGFSRSAVNDQAGANTNLAAIISAALIGLTLLFLTPLFYYLPKTILGAIIMIAVFGLIDVKYPQQLWKTSKEDLIMLLVAFGVTLGLGIKEGIGVGVLMSLVAMIYRSTNPHIAVLGRLPGTRDYRNIKRFKEIEQRDDVVVLRHDAQLFFANIGNFIEHIKEEIHKQPNTNLLVLHCGSISHIDATSLQSLRELISELQNQGINVAFSGLIGPVRDYLHKTGFTKELGESHFFIDVDTAIAYFDDNNVVNKAAFKHALQTNVFKEVEI